MIPAKVTTINDMAIRYTEPQTEELETEGFAEETEAEQSQDVPQDSTADAPTAEETVAEPAPEETVTEPAPEETTGMAYIPEAQVKLPMLSTNHRPWILSDLSDMFHSLSQPK